MSAVLNDLDRARVTRAIAIGNRLVTKWEPSAWWCVFAGIWVVIGLSSLETR